MKVLDPTDILQSVFGFAYYRPGQEAVIGRLLEGRSTLAVFPTGGGKSLCYQIPALMLPGLTLVVSPLLALMKDQIDALTARGVAAARLDSTQDGAAIRQVHADLDSGRLKLLYVAPERLANERFLARLARLSISLLAVDEAHCISEWGHNFRPDYLKIAALVRRLQIPCVLGLTATATPGVASQIVEAFDMAPDSVVHCGFYRPNLTLLSHPTDVDRRRAMLLERLRARAAGATIVYVTQQATAESLAEFLTQNGQAACAYHAGLDTAVRTTVQDGFMRSSTAIVVATIAFGMGIDKADIRYVYHYNLPKSLENYAQEIGRAGRDGQPAVCELLANADDMTVLENFVYGDTPDAAALQALTERVLALGLEFDVSVHELAGVFDIRPLVVETLLTYLELEGVLTSTGPFYTEYRVQPVRTMNAEVKALLKLARKGRTWYTLNLSQVAADLGQSRTSLVGLLSQLEERGQVTLQVSGLRQGYRRFPVNPEGQELGGLLARRFVQRETADVARLRAVLAFTQTQACQTRSLWGYFGDPLIRDCGHCGWCQGRRVHAAPRHIPTWTIPTLPPSPALATPRQQARFLCGLSSPMTLRAGLTHHPLFGALSNTPFPAVLTALSATVR